MQTNAITSCRICHSTKLIPVIDLGDQVLASVTVTPTNKEYTEQLKPFPLQVVRCVADGKNDSCGLVQLLHTYPSESIYREYWYRSGINQTMRDALANIVQSASKNVKLDAHDVVVDIGCNDGTLISNYPQNLLRIGIDPVKNITGDHEDFMRITDFFTADRVLNATNGKKVKVITSIAMFYDLEDPNAFVSDIAKILDKEGVWIVQMADLPEMLKGNMFDQIIHEHLEYYHYRPFEYLVKKHGLKVVDVEKNKVNGSSYRFYIRQAYGPNPSGAACDRITSLMNEEKQMKLEDEEVYRRFKTNCEQIKKKLPEFIRKENAKGKKTFGYGASTNGNVILQYCGLSAKDILFVADRNPLKFGCWAVASMIPIISEEEARKLKPDYMLVLPYYFLDEMLKREKEYLNAGGKFIIPLPELKII